MQTSFVALLLAATATAAFAAEPPPSTRPASPSAASTAAPSRPTALMRPSVSVVAAPHHRRPLASVARWRDHDHAARERVAEANLVARVQPSGAGYLGAMQVYPFSEGALYQVYTAPGEVTDIALEPGETLAGTGPVAAGDTVRWIIGDTQSGAGQAKRVHILVKPTRSDLATNLVINTDRRTYHLELRATQRSYMASVAFAFPTDALIAVARVVPDVAKATAPALDASARPIAIPVSMSAAPTGLDIDALDFRYRITGDKPTWRPLRAFDDGRQVFIQFPPGIARGEMPPLWVIGPSGPELVNYRVQGAHMIVDRLFAAAELRLGGKHQVKVRIVRTNKASS
jgi:P-type conjugative transfer protein TrbG